MPNDLHRYEIKPIAVHQGDAVAPNFWWWDLYLVAHLFSQGKEPARRYVFRIHTGYQDVEGFFFGGVPCFLNTVLQSVIAEKGSVLISLSQPIEFFDEAHGNDHAFTVDIEYIFEIDIPNSLDPKNVFSYRRYTPKTSFRAIAGEHSAPIEQLYSKDPQPIDLKRQKSTAVANRYEVFPIAAHEYHVLATIWLVFVGKIKNHRPECRYVFSTKTDLSKPERFQGVPGVLSTFLQGIAGEKQSIYVTLSDSIENLDKLVGEDPNNNSFKYTPRWIDGINEIEILNSRIRGNDFIYRPYHI